jgi:hypothetical protein
MSRSCKHFTIAGAALALAGAAPALAAETLEPMQSFGAGSERFVTGGVGEQERQQLLEHVSEFDLLMSFANRHDGTFLSGVEVVVSRVGKKGSTTDLTTAGPFLFAHLPAGHYRVSASLPGWKTTQQEVDVDPFRRQRLYFTFDRESD